MLNIDLKMRFHSCSTYFPLNVFYRTIHSHRNSSILKMESLKATNSILFPTPSPNKIYYSLELSVIEEASIDKYQQQISFKFRTILLENYNSISDTANKSMRGNNDVTTAAEGCHCSRCAIQHKPVTNKCICIWLTIKDSTKKEDDDENDEILRIIIPLDWNECPKSRSFAEYVGRYLFCHAFKFIKICGMIPTDPNAAIDILNFLIKLFEQIIHRMDTSSSSRTINNDGEGHNNKQQQQPNGFGCNAEFFCIEFSNCDEKVENELELLEKLLRSNNLLDHLSRWPNGKRKELGIIFLPLEPLLELMFDAGCFTTQIKFNIFRFIYCGGSMAFFCEKFIEYFLHENAGHIFPQTIILEKLNTKQPHLVNWPPPCLANCESMTPDDAINSNIRLLEPRQYQPNIVLPNAKFMVTNPFSKRQFIINIWFQSKNWKENPIEIEFISTNSSTH